MVQHGGHDFRVHVRLLHQGRLLCPKLRLVDDDAVVNANDSALDDGLVIGIDALQPVRHKPGMSDHRKSASYRRGQLRKCVVPEALVLLMGQ
ncbi:hypothetical protein GY15_31330 [Delftia sp. 670]|nr:hypothetical protein GY15_31330 [Delftia sp. 670]